MLPGAEVSVAADDGGAATAAGGVSAGSAPCDEGTWSVGSGAGRAVSRARVSD